MRVADQGGEAQARRTSESEGSGEVVADGLPTGIGELTPGPSTIRFSPEDAAGLALLAVMVVIAIVSVVGRFVPSLAVPYADQMLPDMLVWLAMLGAASAVRWREHLGMSALVDRLPDGAQRAVTVVVVLLAAGFFAVLTSRGIEVVRQQQAQGSNSPAGYPSWWVTLAVPVGAALALLRLLEIAYRTLRPFGGAGPRGGASARGSTP